MSCGCSETLLAEGLITLKDAARLVPSRRNGRPTHVSCLFRWITHGTRRGVRLEATRVGGCWCTSRPALARFFDSLSAAQRGEGAGHSPRTSRQRQAALARAEAALAADGI